MGLIGKLAGKAAKSAAVSAAAVIYDKYCDSQAQTRAKPRTEKQYPKKAGYTTFVIDRSSQPLSVYAIRDELGSILYYVKEVSSGKEVKVYDCEERELYCLSAARNNRAIVRHQNEKIGEVRAKLSIKGFTYKLSWLDWEVEANLLDTERTHRLNRKEYAETKFFVTGQDSYLIYIKKETFLETLLIATFSVSAIKAYNSEHSSSSLDTSNSSKYEEARNKEKRKSRKKTHSAASTKQQKRKKRVWSQWADDIWYSEDDDSDDD